MGCGLQPLGLRAAHRAIVAANDGRPVESFRSPIAGAIVERDVAGGAAFYTTGGLFAGRTALLYEADPSGEVEGPHEAYAAHGVLVWGD